ncbi:hypothetical protein BGZ67_004211, partial [Mortierella alpina]
GISVPANDTPKLQPLDAGSINNFKLYYRKRFNIHIMQCLEDQMAARNRASIDQAYGITKPIVPAEPPKQLMNINLGKAIDRLVRAWGDISSRTIHNCFGHCRIKTPLNASEEEQGHLSEEELDAETLKELHRSQLSIADLGHGAFRRRLKISPYEIMHLVNNGTSSGVYNMQKGDDIHWMRKKGSSQPFCFKNIVNLYGSDFSCLKKYIIHFSISQKLSRLIVATQL